MLGQRKSALRRQQAQRPGARTFCASKHPTQSTDGRRGCFGIVSRRLRRGLRVGADFAAGTVRLDPGETKNRDGRTFYMTPELRACLEAPKTATDDLAKKPPRRRGSRTAARW